MKMLKSGSVKDIYSSSEARLFFSITPIGIRFLIGVKCPIRFHKRTLDRNDGPVLL